MKDKMMWSQWNQDAPKERSLIGARDKHVVHTPMAQVKHVAHTLVGKESLMHTYAQRSPRICQKKGISYREKDSFSRKDLRKAKAKKVGNWFSRLEHLKEESVYTLNHFSKWNSSQEKPKKIKRMGLRSMKELVSLSDCKTRNKVDL